MDAAAIVLIKLGVGLLVLATGFRAVSDDDYARIVIAQRFAADPALDPTGTSWLPLPFWIHGSAHALFGSSLAVARATAILLGMVSAALVHRAALVLGSSRREALFGAAIAAVFPYSGYLGVATVPEALAAALAVVGCASLTAGPRERLVGAVAVTCACAARYEPWAAALAIAAVSAWDAIRVRSVRFAAAAAIAIAFPAAWLLHGVVQHGDALFFVARVAHYRAALGLSPLDGARALLNMPVAFLVREPELVTAFIAMTALRRRPERAPVGPHYGMWRFIVALAAIPLLVMLGDLRGSAPTHHPERALLAVWFGVAIAVGSRASRALDNGQPGLLRLAFSAAAAALVGGAIRYHSPREPFTDRSNEVEMGEHARALAAPKLLIDAPDFGFFAVQASFGAPHATRVIDEHDPRTPRTSDPLTAAPETFLRTQAADGYTFAVLPRARAALVDHRALVQRAANEQFVLVELVSPAPP